VVDPGLDVEQTRAWPQLRHNLVHDLTALNKVEMILWDDWGLLEQEQLREGDLQLLDRVAEVTLAGEEAFGELRQLYETDERLRVPSAVTSYSPTTGARVRSPLDDLTRVPARPASASSTRSIAVMFAPRWPLPRRLVPVPRSPGRISALPPSATTVVRRRRLRSR
jgi:hypothetical protein